jgi:hypothetical protein
VAGHGHERFIGHPDAKIFHAPRNVRKDAASRRLLLISFEGMRKSIRTIEAPTHKADASAHLSDEFPAGYSLMRCSPAVLVSALPAGVDYASGLIQLRGIFNNERSRTEKRNEIHRQRSTLRSPFSVLKMGRPSVVTGRTGQERKIGGEGQSMRTKDE